MQSFALVGLGGAAGSLVRFAAGRSNKRNAGANAVLAVNVLGSATLGGLHGAHLSKRIDVSPELSHLSATGFCGGLTTFSSFAVCLLKLSECGRLPVAFSFAVANNVSRLNATDVAPHRGGKRATDVQIGKERLSCSAHPSKKLRLLE